MNEDNKDNKEKNPSFFDFESVGKKISIIGNSVIAKKLASLITTNKSNEAKNKADDKSQSLITPKPNHNKDSDLKEDIKLEEQVKTDKLSHSNFPFSKQRNSEMAYNLNALSVGSQISLDEKLDDAIETKDVESAPAADQEMTLEEIKESIIAQNEEVEKVLQLDKMQEWVMMGGGNQKKLNDKINTSAGDGNDQNSNADKKINSELLTNAGMFGTDINGEKNNDAIIQKALEDETESESYSCWNYFTCKCKCC